jgi:hypothetical protein
MFSKFKYMLIIPVVSLVLLAINHLTAGFVDFYIPRNLIYIVNIVIFSLFAYRYEWIITQKIGRLRHKDELVFLSRFVFVASAATLAVKYLEPVVRLVADKFGYYGSFYQLYYKYFFAVVKLDGEAAFLLVVSLLFFAFARRTSIKENDTDRFKGERRSTKRRPLFSKIVHSVQNFVRTEGPLHSSILALTVLTFMGFGIVHLGQFMTVDEPKWFETRVPQFYDSLVEEDWAGTYTNDKPGVITSVLSNTVNLFVDRNSYSPQDLPDYLFWWRLPLVIIGALSLIPIYNYLKRLFSRNTAITTVVLLGMSPTIIGMSQVVNPDATLWSTAFLSFITFMLYIRSNKQKYILISGLFFGLGLLSKYFISIFYLLYFAVIYLQYLTKHKDPSVLIQRLMDLSKLVFVSLLVYTVFFPATWFDYRQILLGSLGSELIRTGFPIIAGAVGLIIGELVVLNGRLSSWIAKRLDLGRLLTNTLILVLLLSIAALVINSLNGYRYFDLDSFLWVEFQRRNADILKTFGGSIYTTVFVLTLPTLAGIFVTLHNLFKDRFDHMQKLTILSSIAIIIMFIGGSAIGGFVATGRYQVMLIPLYILIAALAIEKLAKAGGWVVGVAVVSLLTLIGTTPFYINYQNEVSDRSIVINDSWGMGGYELAQKLNSLPDAENIRVWADREGFNEFFVGKTYWRGRDNPFDSTLEIDYLILSKGGERIFNVALQKYENEGEGDIYSRLALQTPLMEYYTREADYSFCMGSEENNCVRAVRLTDRIEY